MFTNPTSFALFPFCFISAFVVWWWTMERWENEVGG
jgi:hypothetical protein